MVLAVVVHPMFGLLPSVSCFAPAPLFSPPVGGLLQSHLTCVPSRLPQLSITFGQPPPSSYTFRRSYSVTLPAEAGTTGTLCTYPTRLAFNRSYLRIFIVFDVCSRCSPDVYFCGSVCKCALPLLGCLSSVHYESFGLGAARDIVQSSGLQHGAKVYQCIVVWLSACWFSRVRCHNRFTTSPAHMRHTLDVLVSAASTTVSRLPVAFNVTVGVEVMLCEVCHHGSVPRHAPRILVGTRFGSQLNFNISGHPPSFSSGSSEYCTGAFFSALASAFPVNSSFPTG